MISPPSDTLEDIVARLDQRIQAVDEERWLSSRYASVADRQALIVLYAFYFELARIRVAVSDETLGQIRFQWWRDAFADIATDTVRQHDVVIALAHQVEQSRFKRTDLVNLIDQHETAFLSYDRSLEPEAALAQIAIELLGATRDPKTETIAENWSATRRGEPVTNAVSRHRVASAARPAVAHFRLRHAWSSGAKPGPFMRRVIVFMAMFTGRI